MIKFLKDWEDYPTAIIHYSTKNKSFIRYAGLLKAMGVKNHAFCLALVDPSLENIDPFSKGLSDAEIGAIARECKINPWYMFREIIRIPAEGSDIPSMLLANRGNISLFWLFFNHITALLIQPRQTGKSVSVDALMVTLMNAVCYKNYIHLLTKDDGLRTKNIARIKDMQNELPSFMNIKSKTDANNTERVTVNRLKNHYVTSVPQSSVKAAKNVGRGYTVAIHHVDEFAYINNNEHTIPAMLASSNAAVDIAKENGTPWGNIFTTTAGYLSTNTGQYAKGVYDKSLRWTEHLYDCTDEKDLRETIARNNPKGNGFILLEFNHRQLGKTDQWLREKLAASMSEGENTEADYLNKWPSGSEEALLTKGQLDIINRSKIGDPYTDIADTGYITKWYVPKHEALSGLRNRKLIMGLDTSEANGGDDISMVIRDTDSGEVVAAGNYNELNTIVFSEWIAEMLMRLPNMTLVIEKRSTGSSMIDNIILILHKNGVDPFKRVFSWLVDEMHVNEKYKSIVNTPMNRRDINFYDTCKKYFGFATSGNGKTSRTMLYGKVFNSGIHYTGNTVRDPILIDQLSGLKKKNGRVDHSIGGHDDTVIAWLLSFWFLTNATNKTHYGLDNRSILSIVNIKDITDQGGREAIIKKQRNSVIRREIELLTKSIKHTNTQYEVIKITNAINKLLKMIDDDGNNRLNHDLVLEEATMAMNNTNKSNILTRMVA